MESELSNIVFRQESINQTRRRLLQWTSGFEVFYFGSFLIDINGNHYLEKEERIEKWLYDNVSLTDEERPFIYRIENSLIVGEFKTKLSITQILQQQLLTHEGEILHLFIAPGGVPKFEFIPYETDPDPSLNKETAESDSTGQTDDSKSNGAGSDTVESQKPKPFDLEQLKEIIVDDVKEEIKNQIIDSFEFNYKQISPFAAHLFFCPTVLPRPNGKPIVINVTTIIGPERLYAIRGTGKNAENSFDELKTGIPFCVEGLLQDTIRYLYKKERSEAEKSAKAAIMSRNMSHNLGSHVMAYLKQHLSSVRDMLRDRILTQLLTNENDLKALLNDPFGYTKKLTERIKKGVIYGSEEQAPDYSTVNQTYPSVNTNEQNKDSLVNGVALPFLVGLGKFISYLQERQDFIATIATDYVPYFSTVNFKDFIYDELNHDKRYERHPDRQNLKPDNILLGNIARSEGLGRITSPTNSLGGKSTLHDIVLKFRSTFNGDPVEYIEKPRVDPSCFYSETSLPVAREELDELRGYNVSLPGGIIGRQAFFSIVENIIRNAAKHGNWREKGKLEISIDIFTKSDVTNPDSSAQERLYDDRWNENALSLKEVLNKFYIDDKEKGDDLFFVTITDNLSLSPEGADPEKGYAPKTIIGLRKAIIEDYVDDHNRMMNTNKGIKEMRISAAWLRSMNDDKAYHLYSEMDSCLEDRFWNEPKSSVPPVLYARISKDSAGELHLQYIFCLLRPQKVAFISSTFDGINKKTDRLLRDHFWRLFTPDSYCGFVNKSFDIVVYDDSEEQALLAVPEEQREDKQKESLEKLVSERYLVRSLSSSRFVRLSNLKDATKIEAIKNSVTADPDGVVSVEFLLNEAEVALYQHLSHWDERESIFIDDQKAWDHFNSYNQEEQEKIRGKFVYDPGDRNAKYRYITHLEDKEQFFKHVILDKNREDYLASEGITGNNSSDRLLRNEKLTDVWFFKHLRALKQKVGVFDERIFSKSFGLEESDLSIDFDKHERYAATVQRLDDKSKEIYRKTLRIQPRFDLDTVEAKNYLGTTFSFKGVFVFSIVRSANSNDVFNLYGYRFKPDIEHFAECIKYATISWDNDHSHLLIDPCEGVDTDILRGYDLLSIHQGLLDKLYGLLKDKDDVQARENLTKDFYEYFVGKGRSFVIPSIDDTWYNTGQTVTHYFLPGMTIHSGRSKPGEKDMPQHLPFIPYSAIEHAVFDCKYSLIELLDSARYE